MTRPTARPARRTLRLAHRGDHRHAPENSLEAMRLALAVPGCDGLEFDVQLASDGIPILLHDETLARTHGRPERPDQLDAATLGAIGVPTLADVLAAVPDHVFLDVELKVELAEVAGPMLAARVERGAALIVSSFHPAVLAGIRRAAPGLERWLNSETLDAGVTSQALELGCSTISARLSAIDERSVATARASGLEVAAWTATTGVEVERLEALGVTAICVEGDALGVG